MFCIEGVRWLGERDGNYEGDERVLRNAGEQANELDVLYVILLCLFLHN